MAARSLKADMGGGHGDGRNCVLDSRVRRQNSYLPFANLLHHKVTRGRQWACNVFLVVLCLLMGTAGATLANRGQPFEFVHTYIKPEIVQPGGSFTIYFIVRNITKNCPGIVHRTVIDAQGNVWPLRLSGTDYYDSDSVADRPTHTFPHTFHLDERAAPGPAVYRSHAKFWCNPFQKYIWPIDGPTTVLDFTISAFAIR